MKTLIAMCALFATGCASLEPTAVNPAVNQVTNNAMALVAASSGDCSVPISTSTTGVACANVPSTSTVASTGAAFEGCVAAAAGSRVSAQAVALKAALCSGQTVPAAPVVVTVPAAKP